MNELRICTACKERKEDGEFERLSKNKNTGRCRECKRKISKATSIKYKYKNAKYYFLKKSRR